MAVYLAGTALPRYLQKGFTLTRGDVLTNRLTRKNPHTPIHSSSPYVDCIGQSYPEHSQRWFRLICNAWNAGGGYPLGRTMFGALTINHADWHNMAASFQWYLGGGKYATYNGFQWYCGYQLAALSANYRDNYWPVSGVDTDLVCCTAAPDGTYAPIEITGASITRWLDAHSVPPNNPFAIVVPSPMLVGEKNPSNLFQPSMAPILCHSATPPRPAAFAPRRRPFFYNYCYAFTNEFTISVPPGPALANLTNAYCLSDPICWHRFFYVRVSSPYSYRSVGNFPTQCQEPGPPYVMSGMANEWP